MKLYLIILTILSLSQNAIARSNSVNATFFKTDITLDAGEPLGGYFERNKFIFNSKTSDFFRINLFKKSVGVSDKNYARGMIIKNKANRKILFLSVDTIALDKKFYKDLISKIGYLGFHSSNVIAIASHTHSGPGTLSKNFMWQFFAMGFYNGDNYKKIIQNIHDQVKSSEKQYQKAYIEELTFKPRDIQVNRRTNTNINKKAHTILVKKAKTKEILGGLINYSVHGTAHSFKNLNFSSDAPGGIVNYMERKISKKQRSITPVFLFANGAAGDIGPKHLHSEGIKRMSRNFYRSFTKNLWRSKPASSAWNYESISFKLNKPSVDTQKCLDTERLANSYENMLDFIIPLPTFFLPREVTISKLNFAGKIFLLWPGEPTISVGRALTKLNTKKEILILSMANNYLGYFTTMQEYNAGGYEACASFYNYIGTNIIINKFKELTLKSEDSK